MLNVDIRLILFNALSIGIILILSKKLGIQSILSISFL